MKKKYYKFLTTKSRTNSIYIYKSDFSSLDMAETDITKSLYLLQTSDILTITKSSPKHDLSIPWIISLNSTGMHYFENKRKKYKVEKRDQIRTYIPIIISLFALVKSFFARNYFSIETINAITEIINGKSGHISKILSIGAIIMLCKNFFI